MTSSRIGLGLGLGPLLIVLFALSQALRDVYFGAVFQGVNPFVAILMAFVVSFVVCAYLTYRRAPEQMAMVRREWRTFAWMNLTTAIAWSAYFFALKHLQPSVVNTLHSAIGPLTVVVLAAFGIHIAQKSTTQALERLCYLGLAASIVALWWVTLSGRSGLAFLDQPTMLMALGLLLVSGSSITISLLLSKRMNDRGIGTDAVTAGRYLLIILVAIVALTMRPDSIGIGSISQFVTLTLAAVLLIALPLYALQLGIARTASALTGHVIRSLGPVFIFMLELVDGRIHYSSATLACICIYSFFAIGSNVVRGWRRG